MWGGVYARLFVGVNSKLVFNRVSWPDRSYLLIDVFCTVSSGDTEFWNMVIIMDTLEGLAKWSCLALELGNLNIRKSKDVFQASSIEIVHFCVC